ncbi:glycosyltransferase [Methylomonas sp. OY6]|uniref:Glycosyltransferase n=1 Tax=Methylomonas defluvii TaxID=3045149 RepID=A0ABU4UAZ2_9GAMM|nr:glycosyltransferase [Methylomonas sp. OY6]MDX8126525.1 glycosyltransferase [Methylomonas sp. OY6]
MLKKEKVCYSNQLNTKMKNALIIFPNDWVYYSPTVLNAVEILSQNGITPYLIYPHTSRYISPESLSEHQISFPKKLENLIFRLKLANLYFSALCLTRILKYKLCGVRFDLIIGVDSLGHILASIAYKNAIYLSLELQTGFLNFVSRLFPITYLLIQSKERKDFFNPARSTQTFLIQNSPILKKIEITNKNKNKKLIYFGTLSKKHGIEACINALYYLDNDYTLTIKGIPSSHNNTYYQELLKNYENLIKINRILFDFSYIDQNNISEYLSEFSIGFCFYDFELISKGDFNYISSPSGKLFNYFSAGIPVIANDIIGFRPITETNSGVLLPSVDSVQISQAITQIMNNYNFYSKNATEASIKYDFGIRFNLFIREFFAEKQIPHAE